MAIAFGTTGSTSLTAGATSATVNITAATVGDWVYCFAALSTGIASDTGAITASGWTSVLDAAEGTACHYALLRRQKQSGDTTFSFGWTNSAKGTLGWASWSGLDGTTPDEGAALATNGVTSRTAVPSPSATPSTATRWAAAAFANRTTNTLNKPITWTPDAAQTERLDVDNNLAGSAPWLGLEIADTNTTVTQAAHSYTATHAPAAESHDGSAIWFLIAAAGSTPIAVTDSGAGSDAATVSATIPIGETGSASDAPKVNATVPVADSGSAADTISVNTGATPVTLTDTGSASDAITVAVTAPLADAASGADALTVAGTIHLAETATAADTFRVVASLALAEAAAALDSLSVVGTIHLADTAAGADAISVNTSGLINKALTDSGTASDSLCVETLRPDSGDTTRPSTGTTVYALATTTRPATGTTTRPNTGTTDPC